MSLEMVLIWILVGAVAGWLAGLVVRGFGFGVVGNIVVGILGGWAARHGRSWVWRRHSRRDRDGLHRRGGVLLIVRVVKRA